jgi:hypothetical protein
MFAGKQVEEVVVDGHNEPALYWVSLLQVIINLTMIFINHNFKKNLLN